MAFNTVSGYGNLPNGNFVPVVYSQKVQKFFRRTSVIESITNTDYYGEISAWGDTVRVIQEPTVTVASYARGQNIAAQDLQDDDFTLTIDQANYFAFRLDDIEKKQTHLNWESMAVSSAAYSLKDAFDAEVFRNMESNVSSSNMLGSISSATDVGYDSGETSPYAVLNRLGRLLDDQNVPTDNRWAVARPKFWEIARDENAKLMDMSVSGDSGTTQMRNGMITDRPIAGFRIYVSNNVPNSSSTGNGDWSNATDVVLAGHMSAMSTASQIAMTEVYRDPNSFADIVRGLHLYGRKVLRSNALAACYYLTD